MSVRVGFSLSWALASLQTRGRVGRGLHFAGSSPSALKREKTRGAGLGPSWDCSKGGTASLVLGARVHGVCL